MKREILFRAKKITDNQWVTGGIAIAPDETVIILTKEEQIVWNVIPETVGQFTGIIDINGINVFEDDILHGGYKVEYFNGGFFGVKHRNDKYVHSLKKCSQLQEFKVIGNVHDNLELLNK